MAPEFGVDDDQGKRLRDRVADESELDLPQCAAHLGFEGDVRADQSIEDLWNLHDSGYPIIALIDCSAQVSHHLACGLDTEGRCSSIHEDKVLGFNEWHQF